ncbi:hypothetical protein B0H11DRAFT_1918866 [Mycena galericulata]|nr:hypothetical protein B0H11DRAFT_1918866 [Mycena galericulata]
MSGTAVASGGAWCASREQGGGERRSNGGGEQGRQAGNEGDGSRQCVRWALRGIKARRARAEGGARDKPGLLSGVELARGRRGGGRSRGVEHDPFSLSALTLPEARRTNRYDLINAGKFRPCAAAYAAAI